VGELRKVLIVNTSDVGGGAEEVAMALLDGFQQLGTETWLVVGRKETDHPRVIPIFASPEVDYRPFAKRGRRRRRAMRRALDRRIGLEDFSNPYTALIPDMAGSRPDVIFCNNLHGGYFDLRALPQISRVPTVLRLADSWTFTGHCAAPPGCERWAEGCGRCPDLATPPAIRRDATHWNWKRKRAIYADSRVHAVTPSNWLLERAQRSILAPALLSAGVVANGVDLDVFRPDGPSEEAAPGMSRLLFVANGGDGNPYKDFKTIRSAVRGLERPVELLVVGGPERAEEVDGSVRIRHLDRRTPEQLAALYRSADLYVHAAPTESFSLTCAEALACGTPVAVAAAGGIAEVVDEGRTGLIVPPGDSQSLSSAVRRLLDDAGLRRRMSRDAADAARIRFDRRRMVRDMHRVCELAA
jgi:glycosyltransferase involved in cell wall biosynthesis